MTESITYETETISYKDLLDIANKDIDRLAKENAALRQENQILKNTIDTNKEERSKLLRMINERDDRINDIDNDDLKMELLEALRENAKLRKEIESLNEELQDGVLI